MKLIREVEETHNELIENWLYKREKDRTLQLCVLDSKYL